MQKEIFDLKLKITFQDKETEKLRQELQKINNLEADLEKAGRVNFEFQKMADSRDQALREAVKMIFDLQGTIASLEATIKSPKTSIKVNGSFSPTENFKASSSLPTSSPARLDTAVHSNPSKAARIVTRQSPSPNLRTVRTVLRKPEMPGDEQINPYSLSDSVEENHISSPVNLKPAKEQGSRYSINYNNDHIRKEVSRYRRRTSSSKSPREQTPPREKSSRQSRLTPTKIHLSKDESKLRHKTSAADRIIRDLSYHQHSDSEPHPYAERDQRPSPERISFSSALSLSLSNYSTEPNVVDLPNTSFSTPPTTSATTLSTPARPSLSTRLFRRTAIGLAKPNDQTGIDPADDHTRTQHPSSHHLTPARPKTSAGPVRFAIGLEASKGVESEHARLLDGGLEENEVAAEMEEKGAGNGKGKEPRQKRESVSASVSVVRPRVLSNKVGHRIGGFLGGKLGRKG